MEKNLIYEINIFQIVVNIVVFELEILLHFSIKIGNYIVVFMRLWRQAGIVSVAGVGGGSGNGNEGTE